MSESERKTPLGSRSVSTHLELGELNLQQLRVAGNGLEVRVQRALRRVDPGQQLRQSVLELAQAQQSVLQLPLPLDHTAQQVVPAPVDRVQRLLDGGGLVGRGALRQLLGLSVGAGSPILFKVLHRRIASRMLNNRVQVQKKMAFRSYNSTKISLLYKE